MMNSTTTKDGRRLTGYNTNTSYQSQQQRHSLYDDDMQDQQNHYYDDDDVDYSDEHDEDDDEDDVGSILSIPDPNINFDLVYALHTFAATVDGQASVVKGDALTLLDDSNSYWWLVKVLKTSEVGYIPAENIETPYERLARLNSHRNIELTRRDIQDAFPTPPSTKVKATKRVTLAKGVKFQAQVIFGGSDDEDGFAEEYEEWNEALLSSDSDDTSSDSDDYDYYSSHLSGNGYSSNGNGNSNSNSNQVGFSKAAHVPPIVTQSLNNRRTSEHSIDSPLSARSNRLGSRDTLDLEQSETIKISLTPSIARGGEADGSYGAQGYNQYQQQKKSGNKLERLLGEDDSLTSPTSPKSSSSGGIGKKSSIRKFFSRGSKDSSNNSGKRKDSASKITTTSGGDSILSETMSISSQSTSYSERDRTGSLDSTMLLQAYGVSSTSDSNDCNYHSNNTVTPINTDSNSQYYAPTNQFNSSAAACTSPSSIMSPSSFTSQSITSLNQQHHPYQQNDQQEQPTTLLIYGGNIAFGEEAKPTLVYTTTTAIDLIQQVVETFDLGPGETAADLAANYYLVVKGVDDDEYSLLPSDQPLSIYHSLTGHLNTPMPSLKKARRISQLMSTVSDGTAHMGGPHSGSEISINSSVRFYLHSKKRTVHEEGVIRIKVSLLQSEIVDQEGLFGPGQTRVDKSLYVPHNGSVGDVAALILERFHVLNGVVDGSSDIDAQIKALRLDGGSQVPAVLYRLNFFRNGQEFVLNVNDPITKAYDGEAMPTIHHPRGSNPDRSSIASMTSIIHSPQADDTFFILRRSHPARQTELTMSQETGNQEHAVSSKPPQRPARPHRPPVRQNTPMPNTKPFDKPSPMPTMHPLEMDNRDANITRSTSPIDMHFSSPVQMNDQRQQHPAPPMTENQLAYGDTNKEQVTPEDGDVLTQLDQALDSLATTRNSNEPLTEAITNHQQQQQQQQHPIIAPIDSPYDRQSSSPSSIASSNDHMGLRSQVMRDLPSVGSTASTTATSISSSSMTMMSQQQHKSLDDDDDDDGDDGIDSKAQKSSRGRHGSIQSMLYWDDFGMDELMIMIRGSAKCQETMEKKEMDKKNRRSSRHYTASIRNEINEVFKDSHLQLEQLEKELDMLMTQAVATYG